MLNKILDCVWNVCICFLAKPMVFIKDDLEERLMRLYVPHHSAAINDSVIWDRPSKVGVYDKDCDCYRSVDWGWGQAISHQMLMRRRFLKDNTLIIFIDFEGTLLDFPGQ